MNRYYISFGIYNIVYIDTYLCVNESNYLCAEMISALTFYILVSECQGRGNGVRKRARGDIF